MFIGAPQALAAPAKHIVSAEAGYAFGPGSHTADAGTVNLNYEREILTNLSVLVAAGAGFHNTSDRSFSNHLSLGATTYLSDVLKYVAYASAELGAQIVYGGAETQVAPRFALGLGLDILRNRTTSWGFWTQLESCLTSCNDQATLMTVGARIRWHWGFF